MPFKGQDALGHLRKFRLVQDDESDPGGRIYRDFQGNIYHSVTRVLQATSDNSALERWKERLGEAEATQQRDIAAKRGHLAHSQAEYLLKTAQQLARSTANKKNVIHWDDNGLARIPPNITRWAISKIHPNMPRVGWSASGYARGLSGWIQANVTEIFASEFSIHHPAGFAGTSDALIAIQGSDNIVIADWKTTTNIKKLTNDHNYIHQCGAYSLGLEHLTGIRPQGAVIVLARRCGTPQVHTLSEPALRAAESAFMTRLDRYHVDRLTP